MPYRDPEKQRAANAKIKRKRRQRARAAAIAGVTGLPKIARCDGTPATQLRSINDVIAAFERAVAAIEDPAIVATDPIGYARQLTATASAAGKLLADSDLEQRMLEIERKLGGPA
jgi:hypothetical protein